MMVAQYLRLKLNIRKRRSIKSGLMKMNFSTMTQAWDKEKF